jgi:hypothetical protein
MVSFLVVAFSPRFGGWGGTRVLRVDRVALDLLQKSASMKVFKLGSAWKVVESGTRISRRKDVGSIVRLSHYGAYRRVARDLRILSRERSKNINSCRERNVRVKGVSRFSGKRKRTRTVQSVNVLQNWFVSSIASLEPITVIENGIIHVFHPASKQCFCGSSFKNIHSHWHNSKKCSFSLIFQKFVSLLQEPNISRHES